MYIYNISVNALDKKVLKIEEKLKNNKYAYFCINKIN